MHDGRRVCAEHRHCSALDIPIAGNAMALAQRDRPAGALNIALRLTAAVAVSASSLRRLACVRPDA